MFGVVAPAGTRPRSFNVFSRLDTLKIASGVLVALTIVLTNWAVDPSIAFTVLVFGFCFYSFLRVSSLLQQRLNNARDIELLHRVQTDLYGAESAPTSPQSLSNNTALHLYLSLIDRDFNENDYEVLSSLDQYNVRTKCATLSQFNSLPKTTYNGQQQGETCRFCNICLEGFVDGDTVKTLPKCNHFFHAHCVEKWASIKAVCPVCKADMF